MPSVNTKRNETITERHASPSLASYPRVRNLSIVFHTSNLAGQYAPRRNGILKACASISTTVNSTVSFTVRPGDEGVDVMEQIFTQPGVGGQTGVYSQEESGAWGNTDGALLGGVPHDALDNNNANRYAGVDGIAQVRNWYSGNDGNMGTVRNRGFIERRADFRSGGGAAGGGVSDFLRTTVAATRAAYVKYDYYYAAPRSKPSTRIFTAEPPRGFHTRIPST